MVLPDSPEPMSICPASAALEGSVMRSVMDAEVFIHCTICELMFFCTNSSTSCSVRLRPLERHP